MLAIRFRAQLDNPVLFHLKILTLQYLQGPFFQIRQHSQVSGAVSFGEGFHATYYRGDGKELDVYVMSLEKPLAGMA